jgi:uncharacterized paraquat-inducible protein A
MLRPNLPEPLERLIGPGLAINFFLFSYVLFEPLLITRLSFIRRNEIGLALVAYDLYRADLFPFLVVFIFGIVAPITRLIASVFLWYFGCSRNAVAYCKWLMLLGRLSMLDIMLFAVLVVAIKGIGIGSVEVQPGLYLYIVLIVGSFALSLLMERVMTKRAGRQDTQSTRMAESCPNS